ncbi:unnamed protein product, partial [Ascophyllum nodosum]
AQEGSAGTSSTTGRGTDRERCEEASVKGATGRRSATSAPSELQSRKADLEWNERPYDPSLKNSWGIHRQGCTSAEEHHRPDATDRERCERKRQRGGDTDRRSVARAVIVREPEGTWTAVGNPE